MRILTNRNFKGKSWEAIDKTDYGFLWHGEDYSIGTLETWEEGNLYHWRIVGDPVVFSFPVEEWFVEDKFLEVGRVYIKEIK